MEDDAKQIKNSRRHDSAKRRTEKIELCDERIAQQRHESNREQEPRLKEKSAVPQSEVTEDRAKQNKAKAMGRVESNPSPPHSCLWTDDRRNGHHPGRKSRVARVEIHPAEGIQQVHESEQQHDTSTRCYKYRRFHGSKLPPCDGPRRGLSHL